MTLRRLLARTLLICACASACAARAANITIEPDDYAAGTALTTIRPEVSLWTMIDATTVFPSFIVNVADGDKPGLDLSATGHLVFAHSGIPDFWSSRRLKIDFKGLTTSRVSIMAGGSTPLAVEYGRLEAYNKAGQLLELDLTQPLFS